MSDDGPQQLPRAFQIELPPEMEGGVYADFASIWHTATSFILDFVALKQPAHAAQDESGNPVILVPTKVVARVRLPPEQVWEIAKGLTQQLDAWEQETGRTRPQEPPLPGPIDPGHDGDEGQDNGGSGNV